MKRILCFLFGHKWNVEHIGDGEVTPIGGCLRCGTRPPITNPIVQSKKELSELARKMEARRKERGDG